MKNFVLLLFVVILSLPTMAQDTFSIIAVDPETGEVGSAGATCVTGASGAWDTWITDMIPGKGGINSQAYICIPNVNLANGIDQMAGGATPSEIIDWLVNNDACSSQNFDPEYRQYGVVDLDPEGNPRTAGWTGSLADDYKEDRQGANYSIQGNILLNQSIIDNMETNFTNTSGTLADKLMAALQGANVPGADARCLANGTSSRCAYMVVYQPDDNPGEPSLRLVVPTQGAGIEPIDVLQDLYDQFLSNSDNELSNKVVLFPNPVTDVMHLQVHPSLAVESYQIFDVNGKRIATARTSAQNMTIETTTYARGLYFLNLKTAAGEISLKFVKQ